MIDFYIYLSISIGCFVFLIQQTDFIYEYSSLFCNFLKIKTIPKWLSFHTYENSNSFENYTAFLGSIYGVKKNVTGFLCRLITCFICLNCFLCVFSVLLLTKNILMVFPCFFLSILTYYVLFVIKKHTFS
jgi:hypothetical protein